MKNVAKLSWAHHTLMFGYTESLVRWTRTLCIMRRVDGPPTNDNGQVNTSPLCTLDALRSYEHEESCDTETIRLSSEGQKRGYEHVNHGPDPRWSTS